MEFYNLTRELEIDDLLNINIPDLEGMRAVEGFGISSNQFLSPLKIKKVNIDSLENPMFTNIRDYCDDETVGKMTVLLHEV